MAEPSAGYAQPPYPDSLLYPVGAKRTPRKDAAAAAATDADGTAPAPVVEKRLARFKPKCPSNILDRVERVMSQRFFMVDRVREGDALVEEFKVLGSTGNIYTVTIKNLPSCDCPDAQKGNHCKHILFVFLKVLQVPQSSGHWYQKALLSDELQSVFANAPMAPNALANPRVRAAYAKAVGKPDAPPEPEKSNKRMPGEGDDCPICYDSAFNVPEKNLTFCETCGNAVHNECFGQWKQTCRSQSKDLACVWCRAKWPVAAAGAGGSGAGANLEEGYVNLASAAGVSTMRDTSSYYDGPRRGERYYGGGYGGYGGYGRRYGRYGDFEYEFE
ncbi:hypothetical protein MKEN_00366500 [Mycena kentingensis (nom. inval.)]|nr:hypothetical protein MKEN_00366500 [Mycena kentingensis (nom. inval.)]